LIEDTWFRVIQNAKEMPEKSEPRASHSRWSTLQQLNRPTIRVADKST
jgi:hypothetical protein